MKLHIIQHICIVFKISKLNIQWLTPTQNVTYLKPTEGGRTIG